MVSLAGFEPALPKELELKSSALDHSAIETVLGINIDYTYHCMSIFDFNFANLAEKLYE